jgi:hypothetical protein
MEALTAQQVQDAREAIWPEEFLAISAEEYERKVLCAEHERSLGRRLERATWEAYCRRHGIGEPQTEVLNRSQLMRERARGFG